MNILKIYFLLITGGYCIYIQFWSINLIIPLEVSFINHWSIPKRSAFTLWCLRSGDLKRENIHLLFLSVIALVYKKVIVNTCHCLVTFPPAVLQNAHNTEIIFLSLKYISMITKAVILQTTVIIVIIFLFIFVAYFVIDTTTFMLWFYEPQFRNCIESAKTLFGIQLPTQFFAIVKRY